MPAKLPLDKHLERLQNTHPDLSFPSFLQEYENCYSYITVICQKHGIFKAMYTNLCHGTRKTGCPSCWEERRGQTSRISVEEAYNRLSAIHGDMVVFQKFNEEYTGCFSKLTAYCLIHGEFESSYVSLYNLKTGCPKCGLKARGIKSRTISMQSGLADYERYHSKIPIDDNPTCGFYGELLISCKLCHKVFTPTLTQVFIRIKAINNIGQGDGNFYCSDKCKGECTVFNQQCSVRYTDEHKALIKKARNCQKQDKSILRSLQIDQYGYTFCEKCGKSVTNPELHHTIEVAKDPEGAITPAGHILVCDDCHKEFSSLCR
jgi:hypothetical protein